MTDSGIAGLTDGLLRLQALNGDPMSWAVYYLKRDPFGLRRTLYDHVSDSKWTVSLVPMAHIKSTTIPETLVPMFACQYPAIRMGVVGEAMERPLKIAKYARDQLAENPRIIQDYGVLRSNHWTQGSWSRAGRPPGHHLSHPTCEAKGLHSRLLGSRWDVLFGDDLVSMENTQTEHQRQKTIRWWTTQVLSRLDPNVRKPWPWGGYHVVSNLQHPRDLMSHMVDLAKAAGATEVEMVGGMRLVSDKLSVLQLAAYTNEARTEVLLPEVWTVEALEQQRFIMGETAFELAYMNNPGGMADNPFREELYAYWTEDPARVSKERVNPVYRLPRLSQLQIVSGWDLGGEFAGNDYTSCSVVGIHRRSARYYWLEWLWGNWDIDTIIEKFLLVQLKWKTTRQNVESNAFQSRLAQLIAREHPDLMRTVRPVRTGSERGKDRRIMDGLEPAFNRQAHIFPEPMLSRPWVAKVLQMLQGFPGIPKKDVLDSMEISLRDLPPPVKRAGLGIVVTKPE